MTKRFVLLVLMALLLVPLASAHAAPQPRSFETRLLHDCIDDISFEHQSPEFGYELHSLDIWEYWDGSQEQVGFRTIQNGNNEAAITLAFKADGADKSFSWTGSGTSWSGQGFDSTYYRKDVYKDGSAEADNDGERFALMGVVTKPSLGGDGVTLTDFRVESDGQFTDDSMPGNDGNRKCLGAWEKASYVIGSKSAAIAYLTDPIKEHAVNLLADEEYFGDVSPRNKVVALQQEVTLRVTDSTGGATVRLHDPSGAYSQSVTFTLASATNPGSQKLIHLAFNAPEGASGTATVELTSQIILKDGTKQAGARVVEVISYSVPAASTGGEENPPEGGDDDKGIPALSVVWVSVGLLAAMVLRRQ